jgi:hypothetical protein
MAVYTTIDDPSEYFQTATYTGGGGGSSVVNDGNSDLQPDLVWFATREGNNKPLQDSTRGGIGLFITKIQMLLHKILF